MTVGRALHGVDLLIGDDTDDLTSPGTGRRCRRLIAELEEAELGSAAGATRHQLLVDPRIPYTSHNSSACIAWRSPPLIPRWWCPLSSSSPRGTSSGSARPLPTQGRPWRCCRTCPRAAAYGG